MKRGSEEELKEKDIEKFVDAHGRNALNRAAEDGRDDIAKVLIQNGAEVNAVNEDKRTPLHWAALNGHVDVAKVLIQNGADMNAFTGFKWTPLQFAAESGHVVQLHSKCTTGFIRSSLFTGYSWQKGTNAVRKMFGHVENYDVGSRRLVGTCRSSMGVIRRKVF